MEAAEEIGRQLGSWLRERLGPRVGIAVARADRLYPLYPEEEAQIARAVERRRMEFSAGRWCARQAMAERGIEPQAIPVGVRMGPVWPEGACGSITHTGGWGAAAAALTGEVAGLGIDIVDLEDARRVLDASPSLISLEAEWAAARAALKNIDALPILFSAKESAIKAMSAKFDRFMEFTEIELRFEGDSFQACCAAYRARAEGWWTVCGKLGFTAAVRR